MQDKTFVGIEIFQQGFQEKEGCLSYAQVECSAETLRENGIYPIDPCRLHIEESTF